MKKISLDKVLNKVWSRFYEETKEDNIETKEIKKDLAPGKDSKVILDPFTFLEKYSIKYGVKNLHDFGISFSTYCPIP